MAMKTLCASISLILLAAAVVVKSNPHVTPQVIYQKLKDALIADKGVLYHNYARGILPSTKFVLRLGLSQHMCDSW